MTTCPTNVGTSFGLEVTNYSKARRDYPDEVFDLLTNSLSPFGTILDIGCGTGIATRQLLSHGFKNVVGCDVDASMIQEAKWLSDESIQSSESSFAA